MRTQLRPALVSLVALTLITGLLYPLVVTGIAQVLFPRQANGSLILIDGKPVGSSLIGQPFDAPKYFWGRPSATSPFPYNAAASSGSNLGPTNDALIKAVQARIDALKTADPDNPLPLPVDLVTASGSGLDPHISPASAAYQVRRSRACPGDGRSRRSPTCLSAYGRTSAWDSRRTTGECAGAESCAGRVT